MKKSPNRFPVIDVFKAIASQLIVLHHLAAYGPIADAVQLIAPSLIIWLYDYARMAVQIFFVIGGYLAARSLFSKNDNIRSLTYNLMNRYFRLVIPFVCAVVLAMIAAVIARGIMNHEFIPDLPKLSQFLSHVFLLHGILDFDSLLAGAWFIAIDFQLFLVMLCISWFGSRTTDSRTIILVIITAFAAMSLFWFNRSAQYDDWALYFFGAYGMGAIAYAAGQRDHSPGWLWLNVALAITAILIDFRLRILIALSVALTLFFSRDLQIKEHTTPQKFVHYLGIISYSLFLVHFSVLMLTNAAFSWLNLADPLSGSIFMLSTWVISLVLADMFYYRIEKPVMALLKLRIKKG